MFKEESYASMTSYFNKKWPKAILERRKLSSQVKTKNSSFTTISKRVGQKLVTFLNSLSD